MVGGQPGQKGLETPCQSTKAGCGGTCLSSQIQREGQIGGSPDQASLDQNQYPIQKITKANKAVEVVQVLEHLPSKPKALSSNEQQQKPYRFTSKHSFSCITFFFNVRDRT
jgi:hypothetical protein